MDIKQAIVRSGLITMCGFIVLILRVSHRVRMPVVIDHSNKMVEEERDINLGHYIYNEKHKP